MFQTGNPEIGPARRKVRLTLAVACFVVLGIMATTGVLMLSSHFRSGDEVALGTALLGLPAIILLVIGVRYAMVSALAFVSSSIRWWHVLWLLTFVSALVFRVRSANDIASDPVDAWA